MAAPVIDHNLLTLDDKSWQAFSNTTIQYVSAVRSAQDAP